MSIHTPYVYLIGWSKLDKFYYGVRFAKDCTPKDLFITYFTSSMLVKQYILQHGIPDIIQIRKTFKNARDAILWETRVLTKMKAHIHPKMLNKTNNKIIDLTGSTRPQSFIDMMTNKIWINDGSSHKRINSCEDIPDGWVAGRIGLKRKLRTKWKEDRKPRRSYDGGNNPASKQIKVNGIIFNTIKEAEISLGISAPTIRKRCRSNLPDFANWSYLEI